MLIYSWGANSHGQLGLGTITEQVEKPTKLATNFLSDDRSVKQIYCSGGHSLLLDSVGNLFSCGWNNRFQLGHGDNNNESKYFERVWPLSGVMFTNIACGWDFSCGVSDSHLLFVWGSNSYGQLGLPKHHFSDPVKPVRLQVKACAVSMGLRHTAILNSKGEVWVTGCGKHGQLGLGPNILSSDKFQRVSKLGKITHIACGQNHTVTWCTEEHALYVWGDNRHSQLLLSNEKYKNIFTPQKIDIDVKQEVKKLLSGWTNILIWLADGNLLTWGRNSYGQLGTKEPFDGKLVHVNLPGGRKVKDVALGSEHTLCLADDNTLWSWGWNEHSNTGTGAVESVFSPTQVILDISREAVITQIYAGAAHNFIVIDEPNMNEEDCDNVENEI